MNIVTLLTIEGNEVALSPVDHTKLAGRPLINLSRLHVVGEEVHAEVDGKPHVLSLGDMLALMSLLALSPTSETNPDAPEPSVVFPVRSRTCRVSRTRSRQRALGATAARLMD